MNGQSIRQFGELGCAFGRHNSAGLRTYTLIGTTAALSILSYLERSGRKLLYGATYSYLSREGWKSVGAVPKATNNFVYTSFRYYIR
jgi:hypothetical protein